MSRASLVNIVCFGAVLTAQVSTARAHLHVFDPPSRDGRNALKTAPCGLAGSERGDAVITLAPGAELTIAWDEYIDHPSHYRVAFDPDGDDDFVDPATMMEMYTAQGGDAVVLLDGIADHNGGDDYRVSVTLPNVQCDNCTLQIVQVMYDKPPYGDGNDLYYQCIDLVLQGDGPTEPPDDVDAGPIADAGQGTTDAGPTPPSSGSDAGVRRDAGPAVDPGMAADAGTPPPYSGGVRACQVSQGRRESDRMADAIRFGAIFALWVLVLVSRRRRRRGPRSAAS